MMRSQRRLGGALRLREWEYGFGLEIDSAGELEVAAAGVAGSAAYSAKVAVVDVGLDAAEGDLVGYVLAIGAEDEFPSLGNAEGAADAAVKAVRAGIAQAIERKCAWRVAKSERLRVAERSGAAFASRVV